MVKKNSHTKKQYKSYIKYSSLATQMLATIFIGFFIGRFIDEKFQGDGLWLALIMIFFVIISIYIGIKDLIKQ